MNLTHKVNQPAPMKNVALFSALLARMVEREPDLPGLAVFHSPSGWGKTKAAVYGANRYRAAYVECGQFTTARSLMEAILLELGEHSPRGSIEVMKSQAIELMAANYRRPLLVDEVHFVAKKAFVDLLRELSDKSGAAVILIGEELLPRYLEAFERVHNRVLEWLPALPCDEEDFAVLAKARCPGIAIAPDLSAALLRKTAGNTRRIAVNLAKAVELAKVHGFDMVDLARFGGPDAIESRTKFTPRTYQ